MKQGFPPGARVLIDGRDEAIVRDYYPTGSTSYAFDHYKVDVVDGDRNVAIASKRVGVARTVKTEVAPKPAAAELFAGRRVRFLAAAQLAALDIRATLDAVSDLTVRASLASEFDDPAYRAHRATVALLEQAFTAAHEAVSELHRTTEHREHLLADRLVAEVLKKRKRARR